MLSVVTGKGWRDKGAPPVKCNVFVHPFFLGFVLGCFLFLSSDAPAKAMDCGGEDTLRLSRVQAQGSIARFTQVKAVQRHTSTRG